jgi:ADP-ribosylglycohydrolase
MKQNIINKIRGSLIGGAIGDAFGYPTEMLKYNQIIEKYGSRGLTHFILNEDSKKAIISDDTQLTLFTAWGLIYANTVSNVKGENEPLENFVYKSYLCWMRIMENEEISINEYPHLWISDVKELNVRRGPGRTTIGSLKSGVMGTIENPINNSKTCGTVMRTAPVGLFLKSDDAAIVGAKIAAITHGHPLAINSAALLSSIISQLLTSNIKDKKEFINLIKTTIDKLDEWLPNYKLTGNNQNLKDIILKAIDLATNQLTDIENISAIGEGWMAEEALAIALYCSIKHFGDFDEALIAAINHNGDTDSTGAITGNIMGVILGYDSISDKWKKDLEIHDTILEIADDLAYRFTKCESDEATGESMIDKYLKGKHPKHSK